MKMMRTTVISVAMCVLMLLSAAQAGTFAKHLGATDPETEGWTKIVGQDELHPVSDGPLSPDPDFPAVDAWQIVSGEGYGWGAGGSIEFKYVLTEQEEQSANTLGWTLTARWRLESEVAPWTSSNYIGVRLDTAWIQMRMGYGEVEERAMRLLADGGMTDIVELGDDGYYTGKLVYNPITERAEFFIDDVSQGTFAAYGGLGSTGEIRIYWGVNGAGDTSEGIVDYNLVQFDVGTEPMCGDQDHPYPVGDIDGNCTVDIDDLAILADYWLERTFP